MAQRLVYVGTYTRPVSHVPQSNGEGIHAFTLDMKTGDLSPAHVQKLDNPSFLAITADKHYLYAVSEVPEWSEGIITAFAINPTTGVLRYLNHQPTSGSVTAHVALDTSNRYAFIANYGEGIAIAMFPINADGSIAPATSTHEYTEKPRGTVPDRQDRSHAHSIKPHPNNQHVLVCDLGLDKIMVYKVNPKRDKLTLINAHVMEGGAGVRHLVYHPHHNYVYVAEELSASVSALAYDPISGQLQVIQTLPTLPDGYEVPNTCSEIAITPDGAFLYVGNRGHDSLAIFAVDSITGRLTCIGHESTQGKTPRHFVIDPTGQFLLVANQDSDSIVTFRIHQQTGLLEATGHITDCPTPVCIAIG